MKTNTLIATLALGILATALGMQLLSNKQGKTEFSQRPLLEFNKPAFNLETVSKIEINRPGNRRVAASELVLQNWQLPGLHGYAADTKRLAALLQSLSDAKVTELKTSKAKNHARLGLSGMENIDSKAALLTLSNDQAEFKLLVGNTASSGGGQFVRFEGEDQTYLIDRELDLPDQVQDWLQADIFDVEYEQVRSLSVTNSEQDSFMVKREELKNEPNEQGPELPLSDKPDYALASNFELVGLPEGKELQYGSILDGLVRNVLGLTPKDIMLKDNASGFSQHQQFELEYKTDEQLHSIGFSLLSDNTETPAFWLSRANSKWLVQLSEFDYKQISKTRDEFLQDRDPEE